MSVDCGVKKSMGSKKKCDEIQNELIINIIVQCGMWDTE